MYLLWSVVVITVVDGAHEMNMWPSIGKHVLSNISIWAKECFKRPQTVFARRLQKVCKAFAKGLEKVWNACKRVCKAFEIILKEFV